MFEGMSDFMNAGTWPFVVSANEEPPYSGRTKLILGFGDHSKKQLVDYENSLNRISNLQVLKFDKESPDMVLVYQEATKKNSVLLDAINIE